MKIITENQQFAMSGLHFLLPQYILKQNISQLADPFNFLAFVSLGLCKKTTLDNGQNSYVHSQRVCETRVSRVTHGINCSGKTFPCTSIFESSALSSGQAFIWVLSGCFLIVLMALNRNY